MVNIPTTITLRIPSPPIQSYLDWLNSWTYAVKGTQVSLPKTVYKYKLQQDTCKEP